MCFYDDREMSRTATLRFETGITQVSFMLMKSFFFDHSYLFLFSITLLLLHFQCLFFFFFSLDISVSQQIEWSQDNKYVAVVSRNSNHLTLWDPRNVFLAYFSSDILMTEKNANIPLHRSLTPFFFPHFFFSLVGRTIYYFPESRGDKPEAIRFV